MAAAACSQGNSDNVMSPEANALEPADVNAALGSEVTNTPDANATTTDETNEASAVGNDTNDIYPPDEPGTPGNGE
ncbi:MAG TPA: hypothetical protein VFS69_02050 [Sphingomicrobium sp.]|nr:hypothetical protein [Sphingomicrobium sp.]